MRARRIRAWFPIGGVDIVLLGVVVAFAGVSAVILWRWPRLWSFYLAMLDVRYWTPWKAVGLAIVLMQSLMVVRLWPQRKQATDENA